MSTVPGNLVLDPFGGSGTTFAVCEDRNCNWLGIEIEERFVKNIADRLAGDDIKAHRNNDFIEG